METKIEGIGNSYGSLHVKEESGKFYMKVFCEVSKKEWREISKELFNLLLCLNKQQEEVKPVNKFGYLCEKCYSEDVEYKQVEGRGLPPANYNKKPGDNRLISWKGMWDVHTCNKCGHVCKTLAK